MHAPDLFTIPAADATPLAADTCCGRLSAASSTFVNIAGLSTLTVNDIG
jgi:hypothetical protein